MVRMPRTRDFVATSSDVMSAEPYSAVALKRAAWHFLSGKVVTGLLTFSILLALVRILPIAEYGTYVSLVAAAELSFAFGSVGLPWVAARFLPEARMRARSDLVCYISSRILMWQSAILFCIASIAALTFDLFLPLLGLNVPVVAAFAWAGLVLAEGVGRLLRDGMLGSMLRQDIIRASLVLRQGTFFGALCLLAARGELGLVSVLIAETTASLIATLVALVGWRHHVSSLPKAAPESDWAPPTFRGMMRIALPMYSGHVLTLLYSPQVFLIVLQRYSGVEVAAVFGFCRSIYEQVARYLPATLLLGLLRPKLVASYVEGGMAGLSSNANLAGKLSLLALMPIVGFTFATSESLIDLLSGGAFSNTGLLFFGFMLSLVPFSQRQILETVAVTADRAFVCTLASAAGVLTLPVMFGLLHAGFGPWAGVAALGGGHLVFALVLVFVMSRCGYRADHEGVGRLALAAVFCALITSSLPAVPPVWLSLALSAVVACIAFLIAVWALAPFAEIERRRIRELLRRQLSHV